MTVPSNILARYRRTHKRAPPPQAVILRKFYSIGTRTPVAKLLYSLPMEVRSEIPPGTLYMLILKTLARLGSMHGYGIAQHIQQTSDEVLQVEEGSLYPALQRMLIKGWVLAEWRQSENNRRARYYALTSTGRKQLIRELREFERVMAAIGRVIQPA
jgi:PadR family transcriptional regulator, regulatory protein PadR